MLGLLAATTRIAQQVEVEPEAIRNPHALVLLAKPERRVVLRLKEDDVLPIAHPLGAGRPQKLIGRRLGAHPHVHDGNRGDERRDQARGRCAGHRVVNAAAVKVLPKLRDEVLRRLRQDVPQSPRRALGALLGPEVEESTEIGEASDALRTGPLRVHDALALQPDGNPMSEANRDARGLGEILNVPVAIGLQKKRLRGQSRLAAQARRGSAGSFRRGPPLKVEEETRQFEMSVAEPVDDRNAMTFEDPSRLGRGLVCDEQEGSVRMAIGVLDELPGCSGVRALLRLHRHLGARAGEAQDGIHAAITPAGFAGDRGDPGDLPQDAKRIGLERCLYLHKFRLIHNGCEYTTRCEAIPQTRPWPLRRHCRIRAIAVPTKGRLTGPVYPLQRPAARGARRACSTMRPMPRVPPEKRTITQLTRRDIFDYLSLENIAWHGRLDETGFLGRIWDLGAMSSTDGRFRDAAGDIHQHRINNYDWPDDWVFTDSRFDLMHGEDGQFLQFPCEMVHPVVRPDADQARELVQFFNAKLASDGWVLVATDQMSGRPIYQASRKGGAKHPATALRLPKYQRLRDPQVFEDHLSRIEAGLETDPAAAIASSKEMVESVCKIVLDDYDVEYASKDNLLDLYKKAATALKLSAESVPDSAKGSQAAQGTLRALVTAVQRLAELRNELGLGHGRNRPSQALTRHARLAFNTASAVAEFLLDTWHARRGDS